jgi:tetratricopeptide (TPR) repeat protein
VKKWIITILAAALSLVLALTVHSWTPWLLSFAGDNHELIERLNTLAELVSKLVMWPAAAILFIFGLWQRKKDAHAERDVSFSGDLVNQQTNIYQTVTPAPTRTPSPIHQLPPPPDDFTGRETELTELRAAIGRGGVHISGLQGQGGVGKTTLALKLAADLAPDFPDAQIYLDLKGVSEKPLTAAEAMSHVLRTFDPQTELPEKEEELRPLYLDLLHDKQALLLFDNAKDAAQVKSLIPPQRCALLVTSRQHFALPGLQVRNLDTLPLPDAKALLLRIAPRIDGEAEVIAKLCGYLPQALRLAASVIAVRVNVEPTDYRKQLAEQRSRLKLLAGDDESVEASITLSYNLLDVEAQKRWRMLAVFPDTFDTRAAAAVWEMATDAAQATLGRLLQYSMLEWNDTAKRYRLHDLMRDFARQRLAPTEADDAFRNHTRHYGAVLATSDHLYLKGGDSITRGLALFDLEWGNLQAGQAWAAVHAATDQEAAKLCSGFPDWGISVLDLRRHAGEQIRWREAALAAARQLNDRAAEGRHLGNVGVAYADSGEYRRAIEYQEKALVIAGDVADQRAEGTALGNLGNAYYSLGEYGRAIEHHEKALVIDREIGDRRAEGHDLGNLGVAYADSGDFGRAIEYQEQRLAIARAMGDRQAEGQALGNLGIAHRSLGDHRRAIEYHEEALTINREIGDRWGEGRDLGNLGYVYAELGETRRAIEYYEQTLAIAREIGDRQSEGNTLGNMSLVLDKLGDRKNAVEHAEASLKIREQIEDPNAAMVRAQLDVWRNS